MERKSVTYSASTECHPKEPGSSASRPIELASIISCSPCLTCISPNGSFVSCISSSRRAYLPCSPLPVGIKCGSQLACGSFLSITCGSRVVESSATRVQHHWSTKMATLSFCLDRHHWLLGSAKCFIFLKNFKGNNQIVLPDGSRWHNNKI